MALCGRGGLQQRLQRQAQMNIVNTACKQMVATSRCSMQQLTLLLLLRLMRAGILLKSVSRSQRVRVTQVVRATGVEGGGPLRVAAQQQQQQGARSGAEWLAVQEVLLLLPNLPAGLQSQLPALGVQLQAAAVSRLLPLAVAALHKQQQLR
jgi:hypothetical protein